MRLGSVGPHDRSPGASDTCHLEAAAANAHPSRLPPAGALHRHGTPDSGLDGAMNRLEAEVKARGMMVFARIDHAAGAAEFGMSLRPTVLLIAPGPNYGPWLQRGRGVLM